MGRCRVVPGGIVRLTLSDDDFVDVKADLNAGEYVDLLRDMADRKSFAKILAYVLGWSLIGLDGQPLPYDPDGDEQIRRDTVRSLDKYTLRELVAALDRHEAVQDAAHTAKKKTLGGERGSSAT
jgi:hypothetical protein